LPCGRRRCRGTGYDFAAEPPLAGAAGGSPDGSAYVVKIPGSADVFFSEPSAEERLAGSMTDPVAQTGSSEAHIALAGGVPGRPILDPDVSSFQDRDRYFITLTALSGVILWFDRKEASPEV